MYTATKDWFSVGDAVPYAVATCLASARPSDATVSVTCCDNDDAGCIALEFYGLDHGNSKL